MSDPYATCRGRPMKLLDLFCGAGGAAVGYHRAGFDQIVGVDIVPQPHYPFRFIQADALKPPVRLEDFDLIHASPPCQRFTQMSARWRGRGGITDSHPDLLTPTRQLLASFPHVIENVVGAKRHMGLTVTLHGGMFGLGVWRPRLFECSFPVLLMSARMPLEPVGVYGVAPDGRRLWLRNNGTMNGKKSIMRAAKSLEEAQAAMGMDWGDWHGVKEAVPPAYTEYLGTQFLDQFTRL